MTGPTARDVLAIRDFRLFLAGRFMSSSAVQVMSVAIGWLVYDITGGALELGLVGLAQFVPGLVLTLHGGHLADRFDRRLILLVCAAVTTVTMGLVLLLVLSGSRDIMAIYAAMAVLGAVRAFWAPAAQSLTPMLVGRDLLSRAVALNSTVWQVTVIGGPAVGGLLYAISPALVFGVAAALVAGSGLTTYQLSAHPPREQTGERSSIFDGIRFVRSRPEVLGAISLDLFAVLLGGATALLPIYAKDILMVGPVGLGLLRSAPAVGAAVAAVFLTHRPVGQGAGTSLFSSVILFGLATIVFGLSTDFLLSLGALVVLGASDMVSVVLRQTLVQINTPDDMRGRVSAVNLVFISASNELGEFESGVTAALLGTVPAVVLGGVGTLAVALIWAWAFPSLRKFAMPGA